MSARFIYVINRQKRDPSVTVRVPAGQAKKEKKKWAKHITLKACLSV